MSQVCKNCGSNVKGNFCADCGQKAAVPVLTFGHIFHEAFHAFTHADKSFLVMLKKMFVNPGKVAYEYIVEGKRKKYFNPFTFFLLITAIDAFVVSRALDIKEKIFHANNEYGHMFNVYNKAMSLVTIPVIALALWLVNYKKPRVLYSEYTVFAMMLLSVKSMADIMVESINYGLVYFFHIYTGIDENLFYPLLLAVFIAYANYQFHKKMLTASWLRSMLAGILFCFILIGIAMLVVWIFLRHFNGLGIFSMYGISV